MFDLFVHIIPKTNGFGKGCTYKIKAVPRLREASEAMINFKIKI